MSRVRGRKFATLAFVSAFWLLPSASVCAAPSQEEVFRSIQDNLGERTDPKKVLAVFVGFGAIVLLAVAFNRRQKREVTAKPLNHPGKLVKELQKEVNLKPAELRQLKALSEGQAVENPLTLLLCPSILVKAAKENPDKFDRRLVANMLKRMGG